MSALTLRLRETPPERLDLSGLLPKALAGLGEAEIARLAINTGRLAIHVGDLFTIRPGDAKRLHLEGGSERFDNVASRLGAGEVLVDGDVGQRLGFGMAGGTVTITGHAGPFAGSGASGGVLRIAGDVGDQAGGAVHGAMHGLNGATLVIGGNAAARLGDRMRRGLILLKGAAGAHAASRMISGTIVAGAVGDLPGYGMRRGTLLARRTGRLPPTFVDTGPNRLVMLALLRRAVAALEPELAADWPAAPRRFAGDMATLGKGEIILMTQDS